MNTLPICSNGLSDLEAAYSHSLTKLSKHELSKTLQPILQNIRKKIDEDFRVFHIASRSLQNCFHELKQKPLLSLGKLIVLGGCGIGMTNIIEGIISGEVLFKDVSFYDNFSSVKATRINAANLLTNAAQNASFTMDGIFLIYNIYYLFLRTTYQKAAYRIIDEAYDKYLNDNSIPIDLLNELYDIKRRELNPYRTIDFEMRDQPLEPANIDHVASLRSKPMIRKSLKPTLRKVRIDLKERMSFLHLFRKILRNCLEEIKTAPLLSVGKFVILCGIGYMMKNIVKGVVSGEVLFNDVSFYDNFSSNQTTQINTAGLLTNAASNVSFSVDGAFLLYIVYRLFLERAYRKAVQSSIQDSCDTYLASPALPLDEADELYDIKNLEFCN